MDPKRTREARRLAKAMDIAGIHPNLKLLIDWTQWAVDLFEECENCEGGLEYPTPDFTESHPLPVPCPSCKGRGFSLNQERVERAALAIYGQHPLVVGTPDEAYAAAEAAILAYLLEGDEG